MNVERPNRKIGQLVARILEGCWRVQPPPLRLTADELTAAMPGLLAGAVSGLAWRKVRDLDAARSRTAVRLREAYRRHALQAALHEDGIGYVFAALNREGIDAVLVKGRAATELYPEAGLRPYGDLDICVRPGQYGAAQKLLSQLDRSRVNIDLHDGFSRLDRVPADDLFARSTKTTIGKTEVRLLSAEDHLRVLCTHALRHGMWRAIWLCDIAAAIESQPADFDWNRCLGKDRRVADWVKCAMALAGRLLGARLDATPAADPATLPGWLIAEVLKSWSIAGGRPLASLEQSLRVSGILLQKVFTLIRHPNHLIPMVKRRWPDPIRASIGVWAPLNKLPRLPFQLAYVALRSAAIVRSGRPAAALPR